MKPTKSIFISSTGTDIGKTYCTVKIIREFINRGLELNVYKPILSGFDKFKIYESDSYKLLEPFLKNINITDIKAITPWLFKHPLAPSIAASKENKSLKYEEVLNWCLEKINKSNQNTVNIFEGAGGIFVPIEGKKTIFDLIIDTKSDVILIVGNYLGSVSHTISAIKNLENMKIKVVNILLNENQDTHIDINDTFYLINTNINSNIKIRKIRKNDRHSATFIPIVDDIFSKN